VVWQWQAPGEYAVVWPPRYATSPIERLDPAAVTVRSRALGAGLAVVIVYAATAILSGHLSPLSRGPLLDGLAPPTAYRWVEPPPELAATNQKPTPGTFTVEAGERREQDGGVHHGRRPGHADPARGVLRGTEGQRTVEVTVEPLAGATAHPDDPLHVVGNVYLVEATYQPSGEAAKLANPANVVIVYPLLANDHGSHSIIWSRSGERWKALEPTTCRASRRPARTSTSSATSRSPDSRRRPPAGPERPEADGPSPRSRSSPG
jgi:hypothetical protein